MRKMKHKKRMDWNKNNKCIFILYSTTQCILRINSEFFTHKFNPEINNYRGNLIVYY